MDLLENNSTETLYLKNVTYFFHKSFEKYAMNQILNFYLNSLGCGCKMCIVCKPDLLICDQVKTIYKNVVSPQVSYFIHRYFETKDI